MLSRGDYLQRLNRSFETKSNTIGLKSDIKKWQA
jgi:hypothetical protein